MPQLTLPADMDPNQGLDTYSKILKLQKDRADTQMAQRAAFEQKNVVDAVHDLKNHPEAFDEHGVPKPDYLLNMVSQAAPSTMNNYLPGLQEGVKRTVEIAQNAQTLNKDENAQIGTAISGFFANPENLKKMKYTSDIASGLDLLRKTFTPRGQDLFKTWMERTHFPEKGENPDGTLSDTQKLAIATDGMLTARPILTAGELIGPNGVGTNQVSNQNVGGQNVTGTTAAPAMPNAGTFSAQTLIGHTPPPGYGWGVDANGNPFIYNQQTGKPATAKLNDKNEMEVDVPGGVGTTPKITQVGGSAPAGGGGVGVVPKVGAAKSPARAYGPGEAAERGTITRDLGSRASAVITAANNTPRSLDSLGRAYDILNKPDAPNAGGEWMTTAKRSVLNSLSGLGIQTDSAADLNTLVKNLAQAEISRASATGMNQSDMARDLNAAASGHITIDNTSLKRILRQAMATETMVRDFGNLQQSASGDPKKLADNETKLRNIPKAILGYEMSLAKNDQEAQQILADHHMTHGEMAKIRQQIKEFQSGR